MWARRREFETSRRTVNTILLIALEDRLAGQVGGGNDSSGGHTGTQVRELGRDAGVGAADALQRRHHSRRQAVQHRRQQAGRVRQPTERRHLATLTIGRPDRRYWQKMQPSSDISPNMRRGGFLETITDVLPAGPCATLLHPDRGHPTAVTRSGLFACSASSPPPPLSMYNNSPLYRARAVCRSVYCGRHDTYVHGRVVVRATALSRLTRHPPYSTAYCEQSYKHHDPAPASAPFSPSPVGASAPPGGGTCCVACAVADESGSSYMVRMTTPRSGRVAPPPPRPPPATTTDVSPRPPRPAPARPPRPTCHGLSAFALGAAAVPPPPPPAATAAGASAVLSRRTSASPSRNERGCDPIRPAAWISFGSSQRSFARRAGVTAFAPTVGGLARESPSAGTPVVAARASRSSDIDHADAARKRAAGCRPPSRPTRWYLTRSVVSLRVSSAVSSCATTSLSSNPPVRLCRSLRPSRRTTPVRAPDRL